MYDETIVAYQDLRVVLAHATAFQDLIERAIVVDGQTVGTWKRTLTARAVVIHATLFGGLTAQETQALEAATQRFGRFLGVPASLRRDVLPGG